MGPPRMGAGRRVSEPCLAITGTCGPRACIVSISRIQRTCLPSLSAALLSSLSAALLSARSVPSHRHCSITKALTPDPVHPPAGSPRFTHRTFPTFHPQPRRAPDHRFDSHIRVIGLFRASPRISRLAARLRRIGFTSLRTVSSFPVALHLASQQRSYLQLRGRGAPRRGLPPR